MLDDGARALSQIQIYARANPHKLLYYTAESHPSAASRTETGTHRAPALQAAGGGAPDRRGPSQRGLRQERPQTGGASDRRRTGEPRSPSATAEHRKVQHGVWGRL